ncbi:MAG: hypothetical protein KF900_13840 [Bacteroidetes bacterium]|nr:hypothetical protein [Bacteroidota bacterium]
MTESISAKELIEKVWAWRKKFLWISSVSAVLGLVIVFLLPKQYKSTAVVFPGRQFAVSKLVIEPNAGNQEDYMQIGDEDDCEKLIQILTSDELKLLVADKFDLWQRWKIRDEKFKLHYLRLKWDDQIKVKRTEFNSVKVEVHDYTANHSAELANGIVDYCDTVRKHMMRSVAEPVLKIVKAEYDSTLARMKVLEDSLNTLRLMGVLSYTDQVKEYSRVYAQALAKNDVAAMKRLSGKMDTLAKFGGIYEYVHNNLIEYGSKKYSYTKMKYDEALVNYNTYIPMKFVVAKAVPNEFKAKPKRMILLAVIILACNVFGLFVLLVKERFSSKK